MIETKELGSFDFRLNLLVIPQSKEQLVELSEYFSDEVIKSSQVFEVSFKQVRETEYYHLGLVYLDDFDKWHHSIAKNSLSFYSKEEASSHLFLTMVEDGFLSDNYPKFVFPS